MYEKPFSLGGTGGRGSTSASSAFALFPIPSWRTDSDWDAPSHDKEIIASVVRGPLQNQAAGFGARS